MDKPTSGSESFTGWGALLADMRATQMFGVDRRCVQGIDEMTTLGTIVVNDVLKILAGS